MAEPTLVAFPSSLTYQVLPIGHHYLQLPGAPQPEAAHSEAFRSLWFSPQAALVAFLQGQWMQVVAMISI